MNYCIHCCTCNRRKRIQFSEVLNGLQRQMKGLFLHGIMHIKIRIFFLIFKTTKIVSKKINKLRMLETHHNQNQIIICNEIQMINFNNEYSSFIFCCHTLLYRHIGIAIKCGCKQNSASVLGTYSFNKDVIIFEFCCF